MSWRWVVGDGVEPAPDALEQLHRARALAPDAVLLAAKVVLPEGALDPASAPMPRILDKAQAIEAARLGLLAVRAVRPGALLIRDDSDAGRALAAACDARGALAASAALLAEGRGLLVPAARATRVRAAPAETLRAQLALVRAPVWTREERLMQLFALAGEGRRRATRAAR